MSAVKRIQERKDVRKDASREKSKGAGFLARTLHQDGLKRGGSALWGEVEQEVVAFLVTRLTAEGVQVTFGTTRDGGALSLTLWDGVERHVEYFGAQVDLSMAVWSFAVGLFPDEGPQA